MALGAIADDARPLAAAEIAGEIDADGDALAHVGVVRIDQPLARVQRAQGVGIEQRVAAAETDLRQARALAHQHRKGARRDLGIERPVIAGLDAVEAARLVGDDAGEHVEPPGRALRIGGGGDVVGQRQAFLQRHDVDAAGLQHGAVGQARIRAASIRRCARRRWSSRAESSRARDRRCRRGAGRGSPAGSGRARIRWRAGSRRRRRARRSCGRAGCPCLRVRRKAASVLASSPSPCGDGSRPAI